MDKQEQKLQQDSNLGQNQLVISPRQSGSIIACTIIGVGVLTLPRVVASKAGEASWLAVLCGSLIVAFSLILITRLGSRFPRKNILEYSQAIFSPKGKERSVWGYIVSLPITFVYITFLILTAAMVKRTFGEVVVTSVLLETPIEVIILTMMSISFILTLYDSDVLARVNEILLPLIVIPILFIALISFQNFNLEFILPVWPNLRMQDFFLGVLFSVYAYQGFELFTVFSAKTFISKKTVLLNIVGIFIPSLIYLLIVIAGIAVFGKEELNILMWPTLELVKTTMVPGVILERMESAFLGVWVAAVFTTSANVYYAATILISHIFRIPMYRRWVSLGLLPLIYWLSLLPQNVTQLFEWQMYVSYIGLPFTIFFPAIFLIVAKLRNKGAEEFIQQDKGS